MINRDFDFKTYLTLPDSQKKTFKENFIIDVIRDDFKIPGINSIEKINVVISTHKPFRVWYKKFNDEFSQILKLPIYTSLEGAPKELHEIILKEANSLINFNKDLARETTIIVNRYKDDMNKIQQRKISFYKNISKYTLVSTLQLEDVPLEYKRKIYTITDDNILKVTIRDILLDYKRLCFSNLVANKGEFSADFTNPFDLKE